MVCAHDPVSMYSTFPLNHPGGFTMRAVLWLLLVLCVLASTSVLHAQSPIARDLPAGLQIPDAAKPGHEFDVDRATEAYIDLLTAEQRALSDQYFEGGYWLQLWGLLYGLGLAALLLWTGLSRRMRDFAERITQRAWLSTSLYAIQYILIGFVLGFPLSVYEDFMREHRYGLATQTFGGWFGDQATGLMIGLIIGTLLIALLYGAVRRAGTRWWIWASAGAFVFSLLLNMIAPVFISPLFNDYKPVPEGAVREAVLSLARANQIPTGRVVYFDASRQTTRVSANVSGTTQVSLNDNLLNKTSLPEIKAVMGHEMGHYVLNHGLRLTIYFTLILTLGLWVTHRVLDGALARWGVRLGLRDRADPAALPLAFAILSLFLFVLTPVLNSVIRQAEAEADLYGLNAAREPHGFATAAMRLSTYRKIRPGYWEEIFFYDHPSGYARVHASMLWLKENLDNPTASASLLPASAGLPQSAK
jgi:STE24 endopeptidase